MELTRTEKPRTMVSLVPMIDVMLIMLVFFMVTSTYLNLDMVPVFERPEEKISDNSVPDNKNQASTMLIRLNSNGKSYFMGRPFENTELMKLIKNKITLDPTTSILVFPSNRADTQSLVALMDMVTLAGSTNMRIIRLDDN